MLPPVTSGKFVADVSAKKAISPLRNKAEIGATKLASAIRRGIQDLDGNAACSEYETVARWVSNHREQLTPNALKVFGIYKSFVKRARADGDRGIAPDELSRMFTMMAKQAATPDKPPAKNPPTTPSKPPITDPKPPDTGSKSLSDYNTFFKRQARSEKWNPDGPSGSYNCAPTSLAMAVKAFGLEPKGLSVEQSIDRVCKAMGRDPHSKAFTSLGQVNKGAEKLGLQHRRIGKSGLDAALAAGHMVCLFGKPGIPGSKPSTYQAAFRDNGYPYSWDGGHCVLVAGRTANGGYVVLDPLSRFGSIELTPAQMKDYSARGGGDGIEVWR